MVHGRVVGYAAFQNEPDSMIKVSVSESVPFMPKGRVLEVGVPTICGGDTRNFEVGSEWVFMIQMLSPEEQAAFGSERSVKLDYLLPLCGRHLPVSNGTVDPEFRSTPTSRVRVEMFLDQFKPVLRKR
jgi:hypothetical protein